MRTNLLSFIFLLCCFGGSAQYGPGNQIASAADYEAYPTHFSEVELEDINRRLRDMDCIIDVRNHPVIESYLRGYLLRYRQKSELILGRIPTYFPIFEEELRRAGLPDNLKYLAVVESALDPSAKSRASAGGLWQFMPGTAAMFGLEVNGTIDERSDIRKSTRAAVQYLKTEYERFGDWSLVLAAYNGGPGRVRRALRRSGKTDYWEMRKFLPRETRNYVPAFVAATYIHKYGHLHGLKATSLSLDQQLVADVACPFGVNLREVAQATQLPIELIEALNPHCKTDYVPAGNGATCRVPTRCAPALKSYLRWRVDGSAPGLVDRVRQRPVVSDSLFNGNHYYRERERYIENRQELRALTQEYQISEHHLRMWNPELQFGHVKGQFVRVYEPRFVPKTPFDVPKKVYYSAIDRRRLQTLPARRPVLPRKLLHRIPNATHYLARRESLVDVWRQYQSTMSWEEFQRWNDLSSTSRLPIGSPLHVLQ